MQPAGRNGVVTRALLIAILADAFGARLVVAQQPEFLEDEVKAAFLYHFATYVEWPESMRRSESITIAVLGAPAVVTQLRAFLPGHTIQNRPVVVRALSNINDVRDAHVLFIGAENNGRLRQLVDRVGQRPVLVVTDAADGLEHGAMVNFQVVEERLRFEISLPAAESVGLMLSSRLLSTAMRVETVNCRFNCQDLPSVRRVVASTVFPRRFPLARTAASSAG